MHDAGAFGVLEPQGHLHAPSRRGVEDHLDAELSFYQSAVDQYNWYGFWDFGDVMHSYDALSATLGAYDIGSFAWDNDEQGTEDVALVQLPSAAAAPTSTAWPRP